MNLALSLKFWLGLAIGAALAALALHGAETISTARGLAGLCLGTAIGMGGLVLLITLRNRWADDAHIED
jgi:hypothetical protein